MDVLRMKASSDDAKCDARFQTVFQDSKRRRRIGDGVFVFVRIVVRIVRCIAHVHFTQQSINRGLVRRRRIFFSSSLLSKIGLMFDVENVDDDGEDPQKIVRFVS